MTAMQTVKLSKWGNSRAIRIPSNILKQLSISKTSSDVEFDVRVEGNQQLVLTKKEPKEENYLVQLFKNYQPTEQDKVTFEWEKMIN